MIYNAGVALKAKQQQLAEKQLDMENDPSRVFLKSLSSAGGQTIASTLGQMAVGAAKYKLFGGERLQKEGERSNRAQEKGAKETRVEIGRHNIATETETERANRSKEKQAIDESGRKKVQQIADSYGDVFAKKFGLIGLKGSAESMDKFKVVLAEASKKFSNQAEYDYFIKIVTPMMGVDSENFRRMHKSARHVVSEGGGVADVRGAGRKQEKQPDAAGRTKKAESLHKNVIKMNSALIQQKAALHLLGMKIPPGLYNPSTREIDEEALTRMVKEGEGGQAPENVVRTVNAYYTKRNAFKDSQRQLTAAIKAGNKAGVPGYLVDTGPDGNLTVHVGDSEQDKTENKVIRQRANLVSGILNNNATVMRTIGLELTDDEIRSLEPAWGTDKHPQQGGSNMDQSAYVEFLIKKFPSMTPDYQQKVIEVLQGRSDAILKASGVRRTPNRDLPKESESKIDKALRDPSMIKKMITQKLKANNVKIDGDAGKGMTYGQIMKRHYSMNPESARRDMHFVLSKTEMGPTPDERRVYIEKNRLGYLAKITKGQTSEAEQIGMLIGDGVPDKRAAVVLATLKRGHGEGAREIYNAMQVRQSNTGFADFSGWGVQDPALVEFREMNPGFVGITDSSLLKALGQADYPLGKKLSTDEVGLVFDYIQHPN